MIEDAHGNALSVGRKTRSIPSSIKRALLKRDACCQFPGCTNRLFMEGHHIRHWADGGETSLNNILGLCSRHHRFVHEYGYRIELDETQRARFFDPQGREVHACPGRPRPPDLGWSAIATANTQLAITADTNVCRWDGDPVDYGHIIDGLVRLDALH